MPTAHNPTDDVAISYETRGDGRPLMLIHGTALTRAIWRSTGYVRALQDEFCTILVDLRGHGRSDKPHEPEAYAMDHVVGDLVAVLDDLALGHVEVFGYSFGARAALALAIEEPSRVASIVLGGGSHRHRDGVYDKLFFPGCVEVLETEGWDGFLARWEERSRAPLGSATKAVFRANDPAAIVAYFHETEAMPSIDDDVLRGLHLPALLFAGSDDRVRLEDSRAAADLIEGAQFHVVEGGDHGTTLMMRDEVLAFVGPFLR
ncbi:MAG TPA: alpha/beta fold hydrolase [Aldersonia sp.]